MRRCQTLTKDPAKRPTAAELLEHPFITKYEESGPQRRVRKTRNPHLAHVTGGKSAEVTGPTIPEGGPLSLDEAKRGKVRVCFEA